MRGRVMTGVVVIVVVGVVGVAWWSARGRDRPRAHDATVADAPARTDDVRAAPRPTAPAPRATTEPAPPPPPDDAPLRYRRLDPAARAALRERIARARRRTPSPAAADDATDHAPAPAPLPGALEPDQVLQGILPVIPALKDCYREGRAARTASHVRVKLAVHLVGEPEVGTLIDRVDLDGDEALRADAELQTCLRETLLAIELPPLSGGAEASFDIGLVLTDDAPDAGAP